jgi:PAS domain S-box-containing protein
MNTSEAVAQDSDIEVDLDLDGRIQSISPIIERTTGFKVDELVGRPFSSLVHFQDLTALEDRRKLALSGAVESFELRLCGKYGELHRMRSSMRLRFDNGRAVGITESLTDVARPSRN